ncbi:hypothetical protein [Streptomyces sp. NPDC002602]
MSVQIMTVDNERNRILLAEPLPWLLNVALGGPPSRPPVNGRRPGP